MSLPKQSLRKKLYTQENIYKTICLFVYINVFIIIPPEKHLNWSYWYRFTLILFVSNLYENKMRSEPIFI